jgi:hypothetical protein
VDVRRVHLHVPFQVMVGHIFLQLTVQLLVAVVDKKYDRYSCSRMSLTFLCSAGFRVSYSLYDNSPEDQEYSSRLLPDKQLPP